MGNKQALCSKTVDKLDAADSQQNQKGIAKKIAKDSLANNNPLKKSFINGQITKDSFKILKVIGRGSFGKVFLVEKKETTTLQSFTSAATDSQNLQQFYAMKVLKKTNLLERNQIDHTKTEREVLQHVQSPFLMKMHYAFQTEDKLYMVMDFLNGGELFFHLRREQRFNEDRIRFYAAEIILGLEALHKNGIIYRDLKPENILMDDEGHIRLTDFGLSKQGIFKLNQDQTYTICGTPEYLAPEIVIGEGHGKAVDWWSLGTLIYEMFVGRPPFQNQNKMQLLYTIATRKIDYEPVQSGKASPALYNLLRKLLHPDPLKRLGGSETDAEDIKKHLFFSGLDWDALSKLQVKAPFKPKVKGTEDTSNIDKQFLGERPVDSPVNQKLTFSMQEKAYFDQFTYNRDDDEFLMNQDESDGKVNKENMYQLKPIADQPQS